MGRHKKSHIVQLRLKPCKQVLVPQWWAMVIGTIDGMVVDTNHCRVEIQPTQGVKLYVGDDFLSSEPICIHYPQVFRVDMMAELNDKQGGVTEMVHVLRGYIGEIKVSNT